MDKKEIGSIYGKLTLLQKATKTVGEVRSIRGLFKCTCGNIKEIDVDKIKNGNTVDCGCKERNKRKEMKRKNRIGETYNKLTAIQEAEDYIEPSGRKLYQYIFECECGNTKKLKYREVKRGKIKSCGCLGSTKTDIDKNPQWGKLKIIKEINKHVSDDGHKSRKVLAECECGNVKEYHLSALVGGRTKDCGCVFKATLKPKVVYESFQAPKGEDGEIWYESISTDKLYLSNKGRAYSCYKKKIISSKSITRAAKEKGNCKYKTIIEIMYASIYGDYNQDTHKVVLLDGNQSNFKIDNLVLVEKTIHGDAWVERMMSNMKISRYSNLEPKNIIEIEDTKVDIPYLLELYEEQEGLSYFMGIPLDLTMENNLTAISLDRMDNSKGYEKGNVKLVTRFENMGRRDTPFEDMEKFSSLFCDII